MSITGRFSSRLARLELASGFLPTHKPFATWPSYQMARLEDPKVLAAMSDATLQRLLIEIEETIRANGGDPDAMAQSESEPMVAAFNHLEVNAHGRLPMSATCGCGACLRHREGKS
jgi:hypothetical protein